ncbi:hypothetical protein TWF106_005011 [Orbilia oligospora]|uniref:Uncharacterized protein n=1 Tax=Orbilia oligospora TaxID=2813651 RepID=A0A7C8Q532_ORBOL|nr:hypothetical protein TWF106_005011 [Orbilia oligospora]
MLPDKQGGPRTDASNYTEDPDSEYCNDEESPEMGNLDFPYHRDGYRKDEKIRNRVDNKDSDIMRNESEAGTVSYMNGGNCELSYF